MSISYSLRRYIRERDEYMCWRCRTFEDPYKATYGNPGIPPRYYLFHVDHLIPRSYGGPDATWNLALACPSCNLRRQDKIERRAIGLAMFQMEIGL